jgi:hypothetical protein
MNCIWVTQLSERMGERGTRVSNQEARVKRE